MPRGLPPGRPAAESAGDGPAGVPDNRLLRPLAEALAEVPDDWAPQVRAWAASDLGRSLLHHVAARQAAGATVYPGDVLAALQLTRRDGVRVVILGQDPYHGAGQAEGMAFSVPVGCRIPPSLRNIDAELQRDLGLAPPGHGHLAAWAHRGVLLLNTALTVEDGQPGAHAGRGWEALTDALVRTVAGDPGGKVFLLWGAHAQARRAAIEAAGGDRHLVLCANHPSPLSARRPPVPFIGCGHFGRARAFADAARPDLPPLDWSR